MDKRMCNSNKNLIYIIIIICMISIFILACNAQNKNIKHNELHDVENNVPESEIFFVSGYKTKNIPEDEYLNLLRKVFPRSNITVKKWESEDAFINWKLVINSADGFVNELVDEITRMSKDKQQNLIIIGHSLGGRIAVRTLARLGARHIRVKRGIFLAAAIPDDDSDMEKALYSTRKPCINIYNRNDYVLRNVYGIGGENSFFEGALGAYGSRIHYPKLLLIEFNVSQKRDKTSRIERYKEHDSQFYIEELGKRIHDDELHDLLFPPSKSLDVKHDKQDQWKMLKNVNGWCLCSHGSTNNYQIISPSGDVLIINDETIVKSLYNRVLNELQKAERYEAIEKEIIGFFKDEPIKVIPYDRVWVTDETVKDWMLQHFIIGNKCRIVDNRDIMRTHGSKEDVEKIFKKIKQLFEQE